MIALNILLGVAAAVSLLFAIGDNPNQPVSKEQRTAATVAFVVLILFIVALNTIM